MYFVIVPFLLSFLFVSVFFLLLSLELRRCSSDLFLSSRPRTGLATTYVTGYLFVVIPYAVCVKYISRYVGKDAPAGVTTVERPHILPNAVHALDFYREKGSALPFPRRR